MMRSTFFFESLPQHSPTPSFKVVVMGSESIGKTSLINRFCFETFNPIYQPSIGYPQRSGVTTVGAQPVTLRLWEVNTGRAHLSANAQRVACEGASAYLVVFDVTNQGSFQLATEQVHALQNAHSKSNVSAPVILIGSKSDLSQARMVTDEQAETYAHQAGCVYFATSVKNNINVEPIFNHVAKTLLAKPLPDHENDWVLVDEAISHTEKLSMILADEVWIKSEGVMSKLKAGLKDIIAILNDHSKKSETDYLTNIQKIAKSYHGKNEKSVLPFFSNTPKDTPLKAAYHAISTASSLSDVVASVLKIMNQVSPAVGCLQP